MLYPSQLVQPTHVGPSPGARFALPGDSRPGMTLSIPAFAGVTKGAAYTCGLAATHGVEVAVGSRSYSPWLESGQMQFDSLLKYGLKPTDRILSSDYFNVVHANSVFTHCPVEIIDQCLANVGRIMAPDGFFDFTFYAHDGQDYRVHREDFYYRSETPIALAERHGLNAQVLDDWRDPRDHQPKMRLTRRADPPRRP